MDDLVNKCNHLEDKCGKLEKLLSKDWKYCVPDIPDSHWEDEEYIEYIRGFLEEIKEQTISLRSGEVGSISLGFDDDIGVLQYDDALLPHWTELANALQFYQGKETYYVSFNRMQLTPPIINILAPGLKENQLKSLWFNGIEFDNSDVIEFAVDIIKANQQLMEFTWQYSQIDSKEDAPALSLAVASHPSIDKVRLENCFGVEGNIGYDALCALFVSGNGIVDTIDLEGNIPTEASLLSKEQLE